MEPELFNYILANQKVWGQMYRNNRKHRKLEINREQKARARICREKKKEEDAGKL